MSLTVTKTIDWNTISALYLQGIQPAEISRRTGVSRNVISVGLNKRGLVKARNEARAVSTVSDLESSSRVTRSKLAAEVERTLSKVSSCDPKRPEALNLHADTLQKVAKTASLVHGWADQSAISVVFAGDLSGRPEQDAIPIESEVEPES